MTVVAHVDMFIAAISLFVKKWLTKNTLKLNSLVYPISFTAKNCFFPIIILFHQNINLFFVGFKVGILQIFYLNSGFNNICILTLFFILNNLIHIQSVDTAMPQIILPFAQIWRYRYI